MQTFEAQSLGPARADRAAPARLAATHAPPAPAASFGGPSTADRAAAQILLRAKDPLGRSETRSSSCNACPTLQPKLAIGASHDPREHEADHAAARVLSAPAGAAPVSISPSAGVLARKCSGCGGDHAEAPDSVHRVLDAKAGAPLDKGTRSFFEQRFGKSFDGVRVHSGAQADQSARAVGALAYTVGSDIVFREGAYSPGTPAGNKVIAHELAHVVQQGQTREKTVQRLSFDDVTGAVGSKLSAAGDTLSSGVKKVGRGLKTGAEWTGDKLVQGGKLAVAGGEYVFDKAVNTGKAALECGSIAGDVVGGLFSGEAPSMEKILGVAKPTGSDPSTLDAIIAAMNHPCVQMMPGSSLLTGPIEKVAKVVEFIRGVHKIIQDPGPILEEMRAQLKVYMANIPGLARSIATKAVTFSPPPPDHIDGIWRHLEPKLEYLAANWWEVVKETGWDLLWPWPGVGKDLSAIWDNAKNAAGAVWDLKPSKAIDEVLSIWRHANSMGGRLFGWFTIASVLVGAIIGAFFGGAGAIPGAGAGFAFAMEVGYGLMISTAAADGATMAKSGYDLVFGDQTEEENEEDYELISTSGISLAILAALAIAGALAARFGRGLMSRVAGMMKKRPKKIGPPPEKAPPVEVPPELAAIKKPVSLAGRPHHISIRKIAGRMVLWLCSPTCGELIVRATELLKAATSDEAKKAIQEVIDQARKTEKLFNQGKRTQAQVDRKVDELATKLNEAAGVEPAAARAVLDGEPAPATPTVEPKAIDPPGTQFKSRSGASGKAGATDVPPWAREYNPPRVGERGEDYAARLLDHKYGPGKWDRGPTSEHNQIQKWADRSFKNPDAP